MVVRSFKFDAVGTSWRIDFTVEKTQFNEQELLDQVHKRISNFEHEYSRFLADSTIAKMSKVAGTYKLAADAKELFDLYFQLYQLTNGAFTPLIGQTLVQAGYDASYSLKPGQIDSLPKWEEVLDYNFPLLITKKPAILDFGAAGKGYIIDLVSQILDKYDLQSYCIDAGGDIYYKNNEGKELEVGLENPVNTSQVIGVAKILHGSICGSAGNRRVWDKFHHIIDPRTLESPKQILATWVIAKKTILADALTTCLFFTSAEVLAAKYDFEYVIMRSDHSVEASKDFSGNFFTA